MQKSTALRTLRICAVGHGAAQPRTTTRTS